MKICLNCGEPSEQNYCAEHLVETRKAQRSKKTGSASARGYDARWARLSRKARKLQPFCTDCGATEDLQLDHSPEAWERYYSGKVIRLCDTTVLCGPCNRARGQARPGGGGSTAPRSRRGPVGQIPDSFSIGSH